MTEFGSHAEEKQHGPAAEAKAALSAFASDFKSFQSRIEARMKTQEDRLAVLDRKSAARPALATASESHCPHVKAMSSYLRAGDESGLRELAIERKGMTTAAGADGGFLVDPQTSGRVASLLSNRGASIRCAANVVRVEAASFEALVDRGEFGATWAAEAATATETAASNFERISIPLHELAAMPKASQRLIEDSAFDVEGWLVDCVVERFAAAEAEAFITGDGADKPRGILSYASVAEASWSWGSLGYVATGVDGGLDSAEPADAIIDLMYALGARYRANATFVMNSRTAAMVRKMKDADGRFLWAERTSIDQPATLMGHEVVICEHMPDPDVGTTPIAFGDFKAGYTIVERPDLRILRDPYSAKPHVQFYVSSRRGGAVTDFSAIKLLKFSAT